MKYTLGFCPEMNGDVIPLYWVAETMAVHAASGYRNSPVHGPTLQNLRPLRIAALLDAARAGRLIVCDQHGQVATAQHLVESALWPAEWGNEDPNARDIMALFSKTHHLVAWGESNGDIFHFIEEQVVISDQLDRDGNVIKAGHYRSYVKWDVHSSPAYKPPFVPVAIAPGVVSLDGVAAPTSNSELLASSKGNVAEKGNRAKRMTWRDVSLPYLVTTFRAGQYSTTKEFYKALLSKASTDGSPFDKGEGVNFGSLFVRDIGKPLALKTLENEMPAIRTAVKNA